MKLKAFQIAVPVRLAIQGVLSIEFPAILDTGLSHNFSMREEHLQQWLQLSAKKIGVALGRSGPRGRGWKDVAVQMDCVK